MEDFLSKVGEKSKQALTDKKSPYSLSKEPTRTAQIRSDTYEKVRKIAFFTDRKVVDVIEDLVQIGLHSEYYQNQVDKYTK